MKIVCFHSLALPTVFPDIFPTELYGGWLLGALFWLRAAFGALGAFGDFGLATAFFGDALRGA
jgi:hypothetical protein